MELLNIFDILYEDFKINKPIKLIEFFAGYGSQALALKYLGIPFQHHKICEWAIPSIIAYADLHQDELENYGKNFCGDLTKEQIATELYNYGVSVDYNKPADIKQLKRMSEETLRLAYNSIWCTNNLVDISRTKAKDLNIVDTETFTYLLTYSFPCQDLSLAGKRRGMADNSTRSGLLWEVERILSECEELPQILIMENVSQVHQAGNKEYFQQWQLKLEQLGYQNYWEDLSATEYGIPQTRVRTFMISILNGENNKKYNFKFPKRTKLNLRLKDLLEEEVDEKYYLSEKMIDYISATGTESFKNCDSKINKEIARPLTTEQNKRGETTNYIGLNLPDEFDLSKVRGTKNRAELLLLLLSQNKELESHDLPNGCDSSINNPKIREISNTITTRYDAGIQNQQQIGMCVVEKEKMKIKNATKKGYLEAESGDGIDISGRMIHHRGTVQKAKAQTITTMGGEQVGVIVKQTIGDEVIVRGNYSPSNHNASRIIDTKGVAPTVMENHGTITAILEENEKTKKN